MSHTDGTGRKPLRPALLATLAVLSGGALTIGLRSGIGSVPRGPLAIPNSEALTPTIDSVGAITFVRNTIAPESIVVDTIPPRRGGRLLFFQGRAAQPDLRGGSLALDGGGGLLRVSDDLSVSRISVDIQGRDIASLAAATDRGLWLTTADGHHLRVNQDGQPVTDFHRGPFMYSLVATDEHGNGWLVRSPDRTGFRPVLGLTPLLARLNEDGSVAQTVGSGFVPKDFLLTHLASAGRIAILDSVIYYAPFIRDEIIAMNVEGDTIWVSSRNLPQSKPEPRLEVIGNEPMVDYAPVNLAISIGMDEHLYVLSVPGFTTSSSRLDVVDRSSGIVIRSTTITSPLPTLAADKEGRVYAIDEFSLLTGVPSRERQPFADFELETLNGATMSSEHLMGRVTLINFWASWCAPCRVELPALDSLSRTITDPEFSFLTMNEDIRLSAARDFVTETGLPFPVLLGRGSQRDRYHYVGLPFTVVVDRNGLIAAKWLGFMGEDQIAAIAAVIEAELIRGAMPPISPAEHTMGH